MPHSLQEEEQRYWDKWIKGRDADAGEQLIKLYRPLVQFHVQRLAVGLPRETDRDELESHGMMGLYDALNKYDHTRDLQFDTYANFRVRGAIIDALRKEDWVPRSLRLNAKKIDAAIDMLQQKYLRAVTAKEVAEETGFSEEKVLQVQSENFLANMLSIDEGYRHRDRPDSFEATIEDQHADTPENKLEKKEDIRQLTAVIASLTPREQWVVNLFYYEELTLTEIGQVLDLSTSRISQIHSKALFSLKQTLVDANDDNANSYEEG